MKKFYAFAAAMLAAGSMLAANPAAIVPQAKGGEQAKMSEEGKAMLRAEDAYNQYVAQNDINRPGTQKFAWTDPNGEKWTASFMENGQWSDNFESWAGARMYAKVSVTLQNEASSESNKKVISHLIFYPRYNMWKEEYRAQLFPGYVAKDSLKAVPLKYLSADVFTTNWKGWAVPQKSATANNFYIGQTSIGSDDYLVIMNTNTLNSSGQPYFTTGSMGYCSYNGVYCGSNQGSTMFLSNFDDETSSINIAVKGTANNAGGSQIWTYDYAFSGEAFMPGWTKKPMTWNAVNMHIVNTGQVSGTSEGYGEIDDTDWGPLQRFYLLACGEGYTYDNVQLSSGSMLWTSTTYPQRPARMSQDAPNLTCVYGALFSAPGTENPVGEWLMSSLDVGFDSMNFPVTTGKPAAGTFLYGGWRGDYWGWSQNDGMQSIYEQYYWRLPYVETKGDDFDPFIMIGTTAGFGYKGLSNYNCIYTVGYKGDITYHYDPNDYLKTRTISSVGSLTPNANWDAVQSVFTDGDNNINVVAANGNINVTVENAANVAIYNMAGMIVKTVNAAAGQTVSVDVNAGIYIVKVGNKAVKVAL